MPHKPRDATRRMASPAQMARLDAVVQVHDPRPLPFESYRQLMRESRDPLAEHAAWKHQDARRATESADVIH